MCLPLIVPTCPSKFYVFLATDASGISLKTFAMDQCKLPTEIMQVDYIEVHSGNESGNQASNAFPTLIYDILS